MLESTIQFPPDTRNPLFDEVLLRMWTTHRSKQHDYADDSNPYSNFEGAARIAGLTVAQVFHALLGVKMERLRQLSSGKEPNHESLDDTLLDLANYAALWLSYPEHAHAYDLVALSASESRGNA